MMIPKTCRSIGSGRLGLLVEFVLMEEIMLIWMYKALQVMGESTKLNWVAGFLPSTVGQKKKYNILSAG